MARVLTRESRRFVHLVSSYERWLPYRFNSRTVVSLAMLFGSVRI